MADQQCLNCGAPAVSSSTTVPLCAQCAAQAKGEERGVKYEKKDARPQPSQ